LAALERAAFFCPGLVCVVGLNLPQAEGIRTDDMTGLVPPTFSTAQPNKLAGTLAPSSYSSDPRIVAAKHAATAFTVSVNQ